MIRTPDADYFLRPVSRSLAKRENFTAPSSHQPHILYKSNWDSRTKWRGDEPHVLQRRSTESSYHQSRKHFFTKRSTNSQTWAVSYTVHEDQESGQQKEPSGIPGDDTEHHGHGHHHNDYRQGEKQRQHFCGRRKKCM